MNPPCGACIHEGLHIYIYILLCCLKSHFCCSNWDRPLCSQKHGAFSLEPDHCKFHVEEGLWELAGHVRSYSSLPTMATSTSCQIDDGVL